MTTANKLALCRGQAKPRLLRLAQAPPNQAHGEASAGRELRRPQRAGQRGR